MAKWKTTGQVTTCLLPDKLIPAIEGVLNDVGVYCEKKMRDNLDSVKSSGRIQDSITWQTSSAGSAVRSNARQEDQIEKPPYGGRVDIGTDVPYAPYIEGGSAAHKRPEGHDQFIADLKDWFRRTFNLDPDSHEGHGYFNNIYEHIVANGTEAHPFVTPAFDPTVNYFKYKVREAIRMNMEKNKGGR